MKYIVFLFIFLSRLCFAQMHDNNWLIGTTLIETRQYQLDFSINPLQIDTVAQNLIAPNSFTSVSDRVGNLLFYTNGCTVNNSQHISILDSLCVCDTCYYWDYNGQILSNYRENDILFLPHPDSAHLYYLFYQTQRIPAYEYLAKNLYYTILDTRGNGGLGSVKIEKKVLAATTVNQKLAMGQLTATKHANGKDWWLIQSLADTSGFLRFLVKNDTIIAYPPHYPAPNTSLPSSLVYQAKFSSDGLTYARGQFGAMAFVEIFDFNRCTGKLSNKKIINLPTFNGSSITFSPNNRFLYVTVSRLTIRPIDTELHQYDLWATDIEASKEVIAAIDISNRICPYSIDTNSCTSLGIMQLAPNNKIYISGGLGYLHTINNPDAQGQACGFQAHSTTLNPYVYVDATLPNFPNYRLGAMEDSLCWTAAPVREDDIISGSERVDDEGINLYPNPANTEINLHTTIALKAGTKIAIYNNLGQVVQTQIITNEVNIVSINVQSLPNGTYTLQVSSETNPIVKSFIVIRQ